jgi:hypothetical protein
MRTAPHILAACLALVGGGCGAGANSPEAVDGGSSQDGGHTQFDGASSEHCACELVLVPDPPKLGDAVHAQVNTIHGVSPFTFTWDVTRGGEPVSFTYGNAARSQVDFALAETGSYLIFVEQRTAEGFYCTAQRSLLVKKPTGTPEQVLLRFIPPAASGIPVQQQKLSITGGTPQTDLNLTLEAGIALDLDVNDGLGNTAPVFVRFVANDKGFETEAWLAAGAPAQLTVLDDSYDVLLIPDEAGPTRFAPTLSVNQALSSLTPANARLTLDPGVEVTGSVTVGGVSAVKDARVMLTRGRLPSTIGLADAAGAFTVRVQAGDGFGLSVAAPVASGLPDLELASGVAVAAGGGQVTVAYDPALQPVNDLAAEVRSDLLGRAVAGARVTLRGQIGTAGTVTVGATSLAAPGVVRRVATTNESGVVSFAALPAGAYDLVVEPLGHGHVDDAVTRATVTLPSSLATVVLFSKVTLSGTLQPPADSGSPVLKNSRVKAILQVTGTDAPALGAAPAIRVDNDAGAFGVRVDPVAPGAVVRYALVADPPAATGFARAIRVETVSSLSDVDLTPLALPRGLVLAGRVLPQYGAPIAGIYIEAHRYRPAGQEDPAARAEAFTDDQGRFSLVFCDPDDME